MKNLILILLSLIFTTLTLSTNAQYRVGDTIEKDGVKAVVVKVDADGNHGLILKLESDIKELAEQMKAQYSKQELKEMKKQSKDAAKDFDHQTKKQHMLTISEKTTPYGKENMQTVIDYCNQNGININEMFPEFAGAASLGEGWFVPGDYELSFIYNYICGGFGESCSTKHYKELHATFQNKKGYEKLLIPGFFRADFAIYGIKSSTWGAMNDNNNEKLNGVLPHCSFPISDQMHTKTIFYLQKVHYDPIVVTEPTRNLYDIWHYATNGYVCEF